MTKHIAIVVDWYGPYSLEAAQEDARAWTDKGLYLAIGKQKFERWRKIQYIGLGDLTDRLDEDHPALGKIVKGRQIWLGEPISMGIPGPKQKDTDPLLDLVEWSHAYFLELPLNEKKRRQPPDKPVTVVNRWWRCDGVTVYRKRPHGDWPVLIDYAGDDGPVRVAWNWDHTYRQPKYAVDSNID
jgi:hypothetical protein